MNNDSNNNVNIGGAYQTLTILWFAMLMSQFIFLIVIFFAKPKAYHFDSSNLFGGEISILIPILAVAGIICFAMSFVFRSKTINQAINEQNLGLVQTGLILGCAFSEAVSIFGLVIAFTTGSSLFLLWFALGILGIILSFPKRDNLIAASYKRQ
jgi:F0F1-type ATP synthase membrane subunit c/vacuolar-type H+-ATPase subunit K